MENKKTYWRGVEELNRDPEFLKHAYKEFPEYVPMKEQDGTSDDGDGTNRRDFLKLLGFGLGAVSLAACEAPIKKAIPYLDKPEDVEPGIANYYATTYVDGGDYCSILVKTREARPIKIEGNKLSPISGGSTSARVQASVLSLYDSTRLQSFRKGKTTVSASDLDKEIISALAGVSNGIRIVSQTILSPSTKAVIADFKAKYPATEHIQYDPSSASGILKANLQRFGKRVLPTYDFSKAQTIVTFGADFLGTWISPIEYARQFAAGRRLGKSKGEIKDSKMSKLYAFETNLSLTGSNADYRQPIKPSQEAKFVLDLYKAVSTTNGQDIKDPILKKAFDDLIGSKGASLVVSGSNDYNVQLLVNEINFALNNYGTTIDITTPSYFRQGDDEAMEKFVQDLSSDSIGAVIFLNANPVYDYPKGAAIADGLKKVKVKISFNEREDETTELCDFQCPDNHFLESWGDAMPRKGFYSLIQPTISPVYATRSAQDSLLIWAGSSIDYSTYLTNYWTSNILAGTSWTKALHDGVFQSAVTPEEGGDNTANIDAAVAACSSVTGSGLEVKLYEKVGMGWGSQAANPWLQELPDPVSKATWDNYVAVPMSLATEKGLTQGSVVKVTVGKNSISLPVLIQPGQAKGTVSIALGYGRKIKNKPKEIIGANAFVLASSEAGISYSITSGVSIEATGEFRELAQTQTHDTIMDRPVVQETTLTQFKKDPMKHRFQPMITTPDGKKKPSEVSIWVKEHEKPNHHWQMAIDLNTCIGCGACVVSCQAENNVPVVGRDEVIRRREMHWIRIDRYYSSPYDTKEEGKFFKGDFQKLEIPDTDNPQVTFMPMLCQHCNHAPCETVCPVAATSHSSEGLNQMAYNRCFGTRYCANNCPYKVRRFNWFKYFDNADRFPENISMNSAMGRMVLNPDVTVRSRGVMEKCSMCVQRIQEGKLAAKKAKTTLKDGAINVACASACPTNAITFGDFNDKTSAVYKEKVEENPERAYLVLEELNVQPNIHYLSKIRNNEA